MRLLTRGAWRLFTAARLFAAGVCILLGRTDGAFTRILDALDEIEEGDFRVK